ncbi:MAG: helix-turn-helix domain-containing protein [Bdellovibrionales bacterium]|nr:helix-turn-helix domain-containing protein [Bdellovibrionales bacterium]
MRTRSKPTAFLRALGERCRRLRTQQGLSIDRLAKESGELSTSVIHRLETGSGAVTVVALRKYAEALGVDLKELLNFEIKQEKRIETTVLAPSDPRVRQEAYRTLLPLYSLSAAAGRFGTPEAVEPLGWIEVRRGPHQKNLFVARAVGNSMEPQIHDGDYLVFRADPGAGRQGKIVLAQYRGPADPDTGGSYTVKVYSSVKVASPGGGVVNKQVLLSPLNPDYEAIQLQPEGAEDFRIVAEYLWTV